MASKKVAAPKGTELELDLVVAGIAAVLPTTSTFVVDGVTYTQPDLLKKAESFQGVYKSLRTARSAEAQRRLDVESNLPSSKRFLKELKLAVSAFMGSDNPELSRFGYTPPRKRAELTVEQKAQKAERARQTRLARHTMGSRQKAAIHGAPVADPTKKVV